MVRNEVRSEAQIRETAPEIPISWTHPLMLQHEEM